MTILGGGLLAFQRMSRLEDPEFTIKDALVFTPYPGATAYEVEEEVTDEIEKAVQQLGQLDEMESWSDRGCRPSPYHQGQVRRSTLPQVWDELRRKVNDAQSEPAAGAGPSMVSMTSATSTACFSPSRARVHIRRDQGGR